jgi:adenylate cyclase
MDLAGDAPAKTRKLAELFAAALGIYENRDWTAAEAAFEAALNLESTDGPSLLYLDRCRSYRASPPPADWDGIYNWDQK